MKKIFAAIAVMAMPMMAMAQYDESTDNGFVNFQTNKGVTLSTKDGKFSFRPYALIQTTLNYNYYDDEGLDKAYNQDNVANSGFAIPYAVLGFQGKAWNRVTFNLALNASASGGALLQQAWFDVKVNDAFAVRMGKFKVPFTHAYLTTLGETLFPVLPQSLTKQVILPYSLNAVTPSIGQGFDLGLEVHGLFAGKKMGYEVGIFNGTGASINTATKTLSDDWHIPSLLYSGRLTYMPWGTMPATQGNPDLLSERKMQFGVAASINVESESESTNDFRAGFEWSMLYKRWYFAAELDYMRIGFTKRMKLGDTAYNYMSVYGQVGYFVSGSDQIALRYDWFNRNGMDANGSVNMPAVGWNHFFRGTGLKLQTMYQYMGRWNHDTQLDRDNDDLGMATHMATVMLQYAF